MRSLWLIIAILLSVSGPGWSREKPGKGKGHAKGFHPQDRVAIVEYYRTGSSGLPPGLAKRGGDLPPGLAKQLRRNGRLPPGLQKKLVAFPPSLEARLAPVPPGCRRGMLGHLAVIWSPGTGLIVDLLVVAP
jgi:hypothetical protein